MASFEEALAVEEKRGWRARRSGWPRSAVPGEAPSPPRLPRARALRRPARALARLLPARPAPRSPRRGLLRAPRRPTRGRSTSSTCPGRRWRDSTTTSCRRTSAAPTSFARASSSTSRSRTPAWRSCSAERSGRERKCRSRRLSRRAQARPRRPGRGSRASRTFSTNSRVSGKGISSRPSAIHSSTLAWPALYAASARRSSSYLRRSLRR